MCDYSLHAVANRPAEVAETLVTTKFRCSGTRGFASPTDSDVAVCLRPGTEIAFEKEVQTGGLIFRKNIGDRLARFRQITFSTVAFQTPTPWDIFETMTVFCKLENTYADPLETPITETLGKIVAVCTRPDLAHRYRNKLKPLEQAVVKDAKWTDAVMRGRVLDCIRKTETSLLAKTKLAN